MNTGKYNGDMTTINPVHRIKKKVDGGELFRAVTGKWTFRLDGERQWRWDTIGPDGQPHILNLTTEEEAMAALREESQ